MRLKIFLIPKFLRRSTFLTTAECALAAASSFVCPTFTIPTSELTRLFRSVPERFRLDVWISCRVRWTILPTTLHSFSHAKHKDQQAIPVFFHSPVWRAQDAHVHMSWPDVHSRDLYRRAVEVVDFLGNFVQRERANNAFELQFVRSFAACPEGLLALDRGPWHMWNERDFEDSLSVSEDSLIIWKVGGIKHSSTTDAMIWVKYQLVPVQVAMRRSTFVCHTAVQCSITQDRSILVNTSRQEYRQR